MVYKLRDLGYYGDFNAADIAELCQMSDLDFSDHHSQMEASQFKALFSFIKDGIDKET